MTIVIVMIAAMPFSFITYSLIASIDYHYISLGFNDLSCIWLNWFIRSSIDVDFAYSF